MKEFLNKLTSSFDTHSQGFSARKLSTFAVVSAYIYSHKYVNSDNISLVMTIDSALIVALLGLTTYQKLKEKQPNDSSNENV